MTIERILICVLFLLMVRMEINFVRLAKKHNGLTTAMGMLMNVLSRHISGLADELDGKLRKIDDTYREYAERRDIND